VAVGAEHVLEERDDVRFHHIRLPPQRTRQFDPSQDGRRPR